MARTKKQDQPTTTLTVTEVDLDLIDMHPLQASIRPWSEKYETYVHTDAVEALEASIQVDGFRMFESVLLRSKPDGRFECVVGWQRTTAMRSLDHGTIPASIEEMEDRAAAINLIRHQGKSIDSWGWARHAFQCCRAYGGEGLMSVSEYAQAVGKEQPTVSGWITAAEVENFISSSGSIPERIHSSDKISVKSARAIALLPRDDWDWFIQLLIERGWGEQQRDSAIAAIKGVQIPEHFREWLKPEKWKREAAITAAESMNPQTINDLKRWIRIAQKCLDDLDSDRPVWVFEAEPDPRLEKWNLKERFLESLAGTSPSDTKIKQIFTQLLDSLKPLAAKYEQWREAQHSAEERRKTAEAAALARAQLEIEYAPVGFKGNIEDADLAPGEFDAVFTCYPSNSNCDSSWVEAVFEALRPGGILVCLCLQDDVFLMHEEAGDAGFSHLELRPWIRADNSLTERWQDDFESVYVAFKPGGTIYFPEPDLLRASFPVGDRLSSVIDFMPLFKKEELLNGDDHPIPIKLAEFLILSYAPPQGQIANPFARFAAFTCAAKKLGYKAFWSEGAPNLFAAAQSRIEQTPFEWEAN